MLAKALTELIAEQEMYARPASDDAAGQNGNAADEVEAEVQLLRPAQDFYDEMERQVRLLVHEPS